MARTRVTFAGHNGELSGLLEYPEHATSGYALFAHCFSCGKDLASASRISRELVSLGIAVLRFDFTGLGNSDGDFANTNFSSNIADLEHAAAFLRSHYQAPQLLIGHSLGGTAVLAAAAAIPEVRAIATMGAPYDPAHVIAQFADREEEIREKGEASVSLAGREFTIRQQFIDDVQQQPVGSRLNALECAVLIMHSPVDATVSINEAEKIYQHLRHPKSFVSLDGADHLLTNKADAHYVADTIRTWAGRYLSWDSTPGHRETSDVAPGSITVHEHNLQFARRVISDEHSWLADEPARVGGHELGPDPYEHLLASLGTCTSMTIRMYANRKKLALSDVIVRLHHERVHSDDCEACETEPCQLERIHRSITLTGDLSTAERERLLEIADRCPVHRTLTGELEITSALT